MKLLVTIALIPIILGISCSELKTIYPQLDLECENLEPISEGASFINTMISLASAKSKIKSLEDKKEQLDSETSFVQQNLIDLKASILSEKENLRKIIEQKESETQELAEISSSRQKLQEMIAILHNELSSQITEMSKNQDNLIMINEKIECAKKEKLKIESDINEKYNEYKELTSVTEQLMNKKESIDLALKDLGNSINLESAHISELKNEKSKIDLELVKANQEYKEVVNANQLYKLQIENSESQLKALEESILQEKHEKQILELEIQDKENELTKLKEKAAKETEEFEIEKNDQQNTLDGLKIALAQTKKQAKEDLEAQKRIETEQRERIQKLMESESKLIEEQKAAVLELQTKEKSFSVDSKSFLGKNQSW